MAGLGAQPSSGARARARFFTAHLQAEIPLTGTRALDGSRQPAPLLLHRVLARPTHARTCQATLGMLSAVGVVLIGRDAQ